jgi:hypothetical protein
MEQQAREQAFISALTTEQFVLQAARSANVGEMTGRATVYMGAVSSSLIAFGFLAQVVTRLDPFVAAVLPAVFLLGEFTFARGVPEVDQGGDQQLPCGEGLRSVLACLPSPPGDGLWSGRSSTLRYGASSS